MQTDIRARRLKQGLSQQQLAQRADCSLSMIRLLEGGYRPAASDVLDRLAGILEDAERSRKESVTSHVADATTGSGRIGHPCGSAERPDPDAAC